MRAEFAVQRQTDGNSIRKSDRRDSPNSSRKDETAAFDRRFALTRICPAAGRPLRLVAQTDASLMTVRAAVEANARIQPQLLLWLDC